MLSQKWLSIFFLFFGLRLVILLTEKLIYRTIDQLFYNLI